jgi:hypothetical protein
MKKMRDNSTCKLSKVGKARVSPAILLKIEEFENANATSVAASDIVGPLVLMFEAAAQELKVNYRIGAVFPSNFTKVV